MFSFRHLWRANGLHRYMSTKCHYDIVIVGGGMVGMSMACALASEPAMEGKSVLLLEGRSQKPFSLSETYSNRVSAINPGSALLFKECDVWRRIPRLSTVKSIQAWDGCTDAAISFTGDQPMSYIVENNVLIQAMKEALDESPGCVTVSHGVKVKEYSLPKPGQSNVLLKTNDDQQLETKLLIGADGFNSRVRAAMGVQTLSWKYDQRSIVATCHLHESTDNNVALQKFTPNGPIALLPLTDGMSSLVWSTTAVEARRLLSLTDEEFTDALNAELWKEYSINSWSRGVVEELYRTFSPVRQLPPSISGIDAGSRASFPLGMTHSTSYVSRRVALVGDAAHRVHPLAGLGANLGFGDVSDLKGILRDGILEGREVGCMLSLHDYESTRLRKNLTVMAGIEGIFWSMFTDFQPLCLARGVGLLLSNVVPQAKEFFTSVAVS